MDDNLDQALKRILGREIAPIELVSPSGPKTGISQGPAELALEHYKKAQDYLRQGNWAEYGRELESLEKVLKEIVRQGGEK
jgi:hypothetical protein